jgi:hypothetical protein
VGRKRVTKAILASAGILTELHGRFGGTTPFVRYQIVLYADDGAGSPGALKAYSAPFTTITGDKEFFQVGFNVPLAAGVYWIGYVCENTVAANQAYQYLSGGIGQKAINTGAAFNPPSDPFGTPGVDNPTRTLSCWAIVR